MNVVFVILGMLFHSISGDVGSIPLALLSRGASYDGFRFPEFGTFPRGYGVYGGMYPMMHGNGGIHANPMHGNGHHTNPMMQQLLVYQLLEKYQVQVISEIKSSGIIVTDPQVAVLSKILHDFSRKMLMVAELLHQQNGYGQHGMNGFPPPPFYGF